MKLNGVKVQGPNIETIVIPRGDDDPIVLKAQAVLEMKPFEAACPVPKPPTKIVKGGQRIPNFEDEHYKKEVEAHGSKRLAYMLLVGLQATEGLEWETVKLGDSSTWLNYETELKDAGFSEIEVNRIVAGVMSANCLSDSKIEEARQRFLASREEAAVS